MALTKTQVATAYARFLDRYPAAKATVQAKSQGEADALGISVDELRSVETERRLYEAARACGEDVTEFLIRFAADSAEERDSLLRELSADRRRALGD